MYSLTGKKWIKEKETGQDKKEPHARRIYWGDLTERGKFQGRIRI
jgi:hypothetical protein